MKLREHVHSLDLEWNYDEPLGVHVLELPAATLLFGAGTAKTAHDLVERVRDRNLDAVVVEHAHPDHYGGARVLRDTLSVEIAAPKKDVPRLDEAGVPVDHPLRPGDSYMGVTPIGISGHTRGSMSFHWQDLVVAGDSVVGSDTVFAGEGTWSGKLAVIADEYNEDTEQLKANLPSLLDYSFETLLVSHGSNVLHDGRQALVRLLEDLDHME